MVGMANLKNALWAVELVSHGTLLTLAATLAVTARDFLTAPSSAKVSDASFECARARGEAELSLRA